jgi:hypothetical protein
MAIFAAKIGLQMRISFFGCGLSILLNADLIQIHVFSEPKERSIYQKFVDSFIVVKKKDLQASEEDLPL